MPGRDESHSAYVGNAGFNFFAGEAPKGTNIVLVGPDGSSRVAASDVLCPNGMVITPDQRTLIAAETFADRLLAFDMTAPFSTVACGQSCPARIQMASASTCKAPCGLHLR